MRWTALTAAWWRQHDTAVVGIEDLFRIIAMNGELEVAFAQVVGQGADKTQKQRLGQAALKAVEGRVFNHRRVEVLAATARGFPLYRFSVVGKANRANPVPTTTGATPRRPWHRPSSRSDRYRCVQTAVGGTGWTSYHPALGGRVSGAF